MRSDADTVLALLTAPWTTHAVHTALRIGVFDILDEGPRTTGDIAHRTRTHAPSLERLLRLLTATHLVTPHPDGHALAPAARLLTRAHPHSLAPLARLYALPAITSAWQHLEHTIRTGHAAFPHANGAPVYPYLHATPDDAAVFDTAMAAASHTAATRLATDHDFTTARTLTDVGGGNGRFLATLMAHHPHLSGTLTDRADVLARLDPAMDRLVAQGRARTRPADFFTDAAPPADVYTLSRVLHNWDDADAARILTRIRSTMPAHARLLVVERLLSPDSTLSIAHDLHMMAITGGRERTRDQYAALCTRAHLDLAHVLHLDAGFCALVAVPAQAH
ncbi:methyltransferase [Nocardiopsis ansamitocini]|uniref:Methyltransferase n=1 Tax=Nocardiopsis ansamitocini TaxID=1670832 RepID=A0A9W6P709_9ACTN|nr:methyltransferase [Nocardiopsis ansamitocini]GLU48201.1 methyltransferase [Nocardiopsis ansamitocini]